LSFISQISYNIEFSLNSNSWNEYNIPFFYILTKFGFAELNQAVLTSPSKAIHNSSKQTNQGDDTVKDVAEQELSLKLKVGLCAI
jgi:hypothetical protein